MATGTTKRATLEALYQVEGKAELIGGRIVHLIPTGHRPSQVAGRIYRRLADPVDESGRGHAYTDRMGFAVEEMPSRRESFCPDAAFYDGPLPANRMRFVEGPPTLAVEVRSEGDHGPRAEREMAAKRADDFAVGTQVVWDVDPAAEVIHVYRRGEPDHASDDVRGQTAEAEPAVPGWRVEVDALFGPRDE